MRERAVQLVLASEYEHLSRWVAIRSVVAKTGCKPANGHTLEGYIPHYP